MRRWSGLSQAAVEERHADLVDESTTLQTCYNSGMNYISTMKAADIPEIRNMSVSEKLLLVEDLWNEIAAKSETLEIPDWHKRELDKSIEGFKRNPREGSSWEDVKRRTLPKS